MGSSVSQTQENRVELFNELVLRNKTMLWHICSDYSLGLAWDTEDCLQEVLVNLWRDFDKFEGRSSEKTWVYRVATNTMLMLRRKDIRSPKMEAIAAENENMTAQDPVDENYQQLQQLIDALPEENGVVIRAFLDGFSYKEIAQMTNSTVGAVAMRIARTKHKLRQMYENDNLVTL